MLSLPRLHCSSLAKFPRNIADKDRLPLTVMISHNSLLGDFHPGDVANQESLSHPAWGGGETPDSVEQTVRQQEPACISLL